MNNFNKPASPHNNINNKNTTTQPLTPTKKMKRLLSLPLTLTLTLTIPLTTAYVGSMTYYTPSLGSCGITSPPTAAIVALSVPMMANPANPNANPKCGSQISIYNPSTGQTHWATIVDTCQGCGLYDIDLTEELFRQIAPEGDGRVGGIEWGGDKVGG